MRILLSRAPYIAHCSLRRAHTARAAVPGLRPSQRRPSAGSTALRCAPSAGQCRPSAGPSAGQCRPSAGTPVPQCRPCRPSAGHSVPQCRPSAGTPCPSAGQCRPCPQCRPVPAFGLQPALRASIVHQCRPCFRVPNAPSHRVHVQASAALPLPA